ncbi:mitochondrial inner membrane protease subunit 1 isoform X2 [Amborella trichopoda]|uniref:mitochondrial inner membrane protease subunit 1 isoform X2 n=1 Tax=Amborella trichopoda TaxID=13333 RepID=UPI0009BF0B18|nr:mitochondrial inner membrane protease subunit 1 isoform X2 [Amborella trichopoda]|eukprot:XP_020526185.1 mitochondrial inner membrane protease subunit 1 isoform X2 [Amborella trichopoda]
MARRLFERARSIPWRSIAREAFDTVSFFTKFACVVHITHTYVGGIALSSGPSMLPTLSLTGDVVVIDRITTNFGKIKQGDLVLLRSPENPRKVILKRVTGLEGDHIRYLSTENGHLGENIVPKGHVWVEGDNLSTSNDSRKFGAIPYGLLHGRIFFRIWPIDRFGLLE